MSQVEALSISAIVSEGAGGIRKCYQQGISKDDFVTYEEEFEWVEERVGSRLPLNPRVFRRKFPDFEWLTPTERLQDLLADLRQERAFTDMTSLVNTLAEQMEVDNAVTMAETARDILTGITRQYSPSADHALIAGWKSHLEDQKRLRALRNAGEPPGIPTGLEWIDHHWDGLVNGRIVIVLGRPGEGKTYLLNRFGVNAILPWNKYRVVIFSPEMNKHEHTCRVHTLLSAYPDIKKACGLEHSFRNRALMAGVGYPLKKYKRFLEYLEGECGEIILISGTHRRQKMTPAFIDAKIADLGPDLVLIDPIYKLHSAKNRNSRVEELSDIADGIADLAETYNVPIVASNQAHRQMTGKDDAPGKDTSFNSDVPIQEADHVIGVKNISSEQKMLLRCTKSRFGEDFRFELRFYPNTGVMKEIDKPTNNYMNGSDDLDEAEEEELRRIVSGGGEE